PLLGVVGGGRGGGAVEEPVRLVVDDEHARALAGEHVEHAGDTATRGTEREGERLLAPQLGGTTEASGQIRAGEAVDERRDRRDVSLVGRGQAAGPGGAGDRGSRGRPGATRVEALEQGVRER